MLPPESSLEEETKGSVKRSRRAGGPYRRTGGEGTEKGEERRDRTGGGINRGKAKEEARPHQKGGKTTTVKGPNLCKSENLRKYFHYFS